MYSSGDFIKFIDINEFSGFIISYEERYEVMATYTCGSFEILDDEGNACWIDVSKHEYIVKDDRNDW